MRLVDSLMIILGEKPLQPLEDDDEECFPHSIMTEYLPPVLEQLSKIRKEQQKKIHYNVHVYQILPYPPNTKEPHNHSKLN